MVPYKPALLIYLFVPYLTAIVMITTARTEERTGVTHEAPHATLRYMSEPTPYDLPYYTLSCEN